jgi:hypothetical protein
MRAWLEDIAGAIFMIVFICGIAAAVSGAAILMHRAHELASVELP